MPETRQDYHLLNTYYVLLTLIITEWGAKLQTQVSYRMPSLSPLVVWLYLAIPLYSLRLLLLLVPTCIFNGIIAFVTSRRGILREPLFAHFWILKYWNSRTWHIVSAGYMFIELNLSLPYRFRHWKENNFIGFNFIGNKWKSHYIFSDCNMYCSFRRHIWHHSKFGNET